MRKYFRSISGRLTTSILLAVTVPLLVSSLIVGAAFDNQLDTIIEKRLEAGLTTFSLILHYRQRDLIEGLERIAADNMVRMTLELKMVSQMKHYLALQISALELTSVCVADVDGKPIATAGLSELSCSVPIRMDRSVNLIGSGGALFFGYSVPLSEDGRFLGYALGLISLTGRNFQTSLREKLMNSFMIWVDGKAALSDIAPEIIRKMPNAPRPGRMLDIQAGNSSYRTMVQAKDYGSNQLAYALLLPLDSLRHRFQLPMSVAGAAMAIIFGTIMFLARRSTKESNLTGATQNTRAGAVSDSEGVDFTLHPREKAALRITQFSFDKAVIGIYWIGSKGQILKVNEKAARNLGYGIDEMTALSIFDIDLLVDCDNWGAVWRKLYEKGLYSFETVHRGKGGVKMPVEIFCRPFEYADHQLLIAFVQDISDRKYAEKEAHRLGDALVQAQKMEAIGTLAGGIAHDFNNILSAMIGYSELSLAEVAPDTPVHGYLRQILAAGMRARDLVQQILTFSRKDNRQMRPMKADSQVKEALKLLRSTLPATIEISQQIDSGIDPVLAHPTQIHQIVMNLCTNAAHAMEDDGGLLRVSLSQVRLSERDTGLHPGLMPGKYLKLSIQDTGRGISPEIIKKIYDPYFTTKEKGKGTGLGLSVVHGIVQSYGGAIYAYSEANRGTTFNVYIPSIKKQSLNESLVTAELPGGDEHILLVDDEPALIEVGCKLLEKLGYRVSTARTGAAALEIFRRSPRSIDLVVTDMTMPKMTGEQLAAELLSIRPDLAILLVTGYNINIFGDRANELGIQAILTKPVVEADLARTVRKVLDETKKTSSTLFSDRTAGEPDTN